MNTRALLLLASIAAPVGALQAQSRATMPAFATQAELRDFLNEIIARRNRVARRQSMAAPMAAQADASAMGAGESITNTQHAGVDEGGIVKRVGDYLVVLRRGRLFTVNIGGSALHPVASIDAFGPGISPDGAWYDEMLISGDKIVVIGYSYQRGGTEVGIFSIGNDGSLTYQATFQLRSNDYYSSRNYAARLIGSKLVFYAPLYLPWNAASMDDMLPAVQHWRGPEGQRRFVPIVRANRVYRPAGWRASDNVALHTVTSCELSGDMRCEATVVIGPPGNVFYVSPGSVYVWMSEWSGPEDGARSMLARIPLDGGAPSSIGVGGSPVDQFSFLERDGYLNVMTRSDGRGTWMWSSERSTGQAALLRLPLSRLGDGSQRAPNWWYRPLEAPAGYTFQNRFVGEYLLYGAGNGWGAQTANDSALFVVPIRGGDTHTLTLGHSTDRIEVMGNDAVVVGVRRGNLEFSGIRLGGVPSIGQRFTLPGASQGELRSHGYFYRNDGDGSGVLGLPVAEAGRPGYRHLVQGSASILFLRNTGDGFARLGKLEAGAVGNVNDNCRASCVDWYGNARPIFTRGRVLALMGYELVEGRVRDGVMMEVRRTSFAPGFVHLTRQ